MASFPQCIGCGSLVCILGLLVAGSVCRDGGVGALSTQCFQVLVSQETFAPIGNAVRDHDQIVIQSSDDGNGLWCHVAHGFDGSGATKAELGESLA